MVEPERLIRRAHKIYSLFHEGCNSFVEGNGSIAFPYTCRCGVWEYDAGKSTWILVTQNIETKRSQDEN